MRRVVEFAAVDPTAPRGRSCAAGAAAPAAAPCCGFNLCYKYFWYFWYSVFYDAVSDAAGLRVRVMPPREPECVPAVVRVDGSRRGLRVRVMPPREPECVSADVRVDGSRAHARAVAHNAQLFVCLFARPNRRPRGTRAMCGGAQGATYTSTCVLTTRGRRVS